MIDSTTPVVSVIMITYLHELFISEAINGVLMQQCDFDIELIIADDCSPDNTTVVVESFKNHPNYRWIKYIRHETNKGMMDNFIWAINKASGKHIALCEGDDYWTDPFKLKKQMDFLEKNSKFSAIFHNVEQRWEEAEKSCLYLREKRFQQALELNIEDFIGENIVPTCSLFFKKESLYKSINTIPWKQLDYGDWPMVIVLATNGSVYYQPMISAVRRMNPASIWGLQDQKINILKTFKTRNIIKKTGLIDNNLMIEMKLYEFQLFLKLHEIKEFSFFKWTKRGINYIKLILEKMSNSILELNYKYKFKKTVESK